MHDILTEIDAGLERIRQRGGQDTIHYANLQAKREAIAGGASYRVVDVTEALIGGVGAMFATINRGSNGQGLPARGSLPALWKRFSEAAEQSAVFYPARPCQGELSRLSERGSVDMDASETLCQNPSCRRKLEQVAGGHRPRLYCDDVCRQKAFRVRQVEARRRQYALQVQTWGDFQSGTVDYLAGWLLVGNEEGARKLAALILSEQGQARSLAESGAQGEQHLAALREKQLRRVEKLKARIHQLEQALQERAAGQEDQRNIEDYREKLAQASARIGKLEKQVEIQRQRLGQYYQRFYPSTLAAAEERLLALGATVNYRRLLKYNELTVDIGAGPEAWREFARTADVDTLALAIVQAQRFHDNLQAVHASANRDSLAAHD